ncbi:MAG: PA14 domain-containing protein [Caldilineaceae bacterium]
MLKSVTCLVAIAAAFLLNYFLPASSSTRNYLLITAITGLVFAWCAPAPRTKFTLKRIIKGLDGVEIKARFVNSPLWINGLTFCALIVGGASAWLLNQDLGNVNGLILWFASIALLLLAWWWHTNPDIKSDNALVTAEDRQPLGVEWLLLATILIAAFTVRIWRLDLFPNGMQSDEGGNARDALRWLAGAPYTPYAETNVGQASMFTYMIALIFKIFGVSLETMRLTSVLMGTITVAAFYPLARKFFSSPVALFATALLAFDRWHMTFSRIVYELILTPLALILSYYFVYLAISERRGRYWVLGGLAVAFGLNTYTAFRISVMGVPLFILFWLLRDYRSIIANIKWLILYGISVLLGLLPLAIYTIHHADIVLLRTRQVFIGTEIAQVGSYEPLWYNIRRYLEMFTIHGDPAGLNNLPNEPMLSWTVGVLALLGLCYAIYHCWKLEMFMLLAWIIGVLPAGILSVTVETPSARRVIGMVPLVYLLVAVVAEAVWRLSIQNLPRVGSVIWRIAAILVVAYICYTNLQQFYSVQFKNQAVIESFNPTESSVGRYLHNLDAESTTVYVDAAFHDNAVVDFLSERFPHALFSLIADLPLRNAPIDKNVIFVLSPNSDALKPLFSSFYPEGQWKDHRNPLGTITFQTFSIADQQLDQLQGLTTSFYSDSSRKQPALVVQRQAQVGILPSPLPAPYAVTWEGTIFMPVHGTYTFAITTSTPITLAIDNMVILTSSQRTQISETRMLSVAQPFVAGFHDIVLQSDIASYLPTLPKLYWQSPLEETTEVPANALLPNRLPPIGLIGSYYDNSNWDGAPFMVRRDLAIIADEAINRDYSVIWTGQLNAPKAGHYQFGTTSDDGSLVYLDGKLLLDNGTAGGSHRLEVATELSAGLHDLEIRYFQSGGSRLLRFDWQPPDMPWQTVTGEALLSSAVDQSALVNAAQPAQLIVEQSTQPVAVSTSDTSSLEVHEIYGGLEAPAGIAIGHDQQIYVVESGRRRLLVISEGGELLSEVTMGDVPFSEPFDVAVGLSGNLYVQDGGLGKVIQFDSNGQYLQSLPANPQFERTRGIYVDDEEQFWVAHTSAGQIMSGKQGSEDIVTLPRPSFSNFQPVDVLVHQNGNVWITDDGQHQLYILSKQGELLFADAIPATATLSGSHLAASEDGFVYMTQPEAGKVVKYDATGTAVEAFDLRNTTVIRPVGIAIDGQQRIWVSDFERGTVDLIIPPPSSTLQPNSPLSSPPAQSVSPLSTQ